MDSSAIGEVISMFLKLALFMVVILIVAAFSFGRCSSEEPTKAVTVKQPLEPEKVIITRDGKTDTTYVYRMPEE